MDAVLALLARLVLWWDEAIRRSRLLGGLANARCCESRGCDSPATHLESGANGRSEVAASVIFELTSVLPTSVNLTGAWRMLDQVCPS